LQYHLKYRAKIRPPAREELEDNLALRRGREVHKNIELILKGDLAEGDPFTPGLDNESRKMINQWLAVCAPTMPHGTLDIYSERRFDAFFHEYPMMGYLDAFWVDDTKEPHTAYICDIKTGDNLYFLEKKMWFSLQPDIYAVLVRENLPFPADIVWVQHNVTAKEATVTTRPVLLTPARESVLLSWLQRMALDDATPKESWECSRCQFESICEGRLRLGDRKFEAKETDNALSNLPDESDEA